MAVWPAFDFLAGRLTLAELNNLNDVEARSALTSCCGSTRWVSEMINARPFASLDALHATADAAWSTTTPSDWLEAFSHHPRIGEKVSGAAGAEQASAQSAATTIKEQLAAVNQLYEEKFGHIYIVCATGKTAEEMLAIAKSRLGNERDAELRIAAEEQRKIMQLRLGKLLS